MLLRTSLRMLDAPAKAHLVTGDFEWIDILVVGVVGSCDVFYGRCGR
jgi:hypothetical protein